MKSPGHQKWPEHRVREKHVDGRVFVEVDGEMIADSNDVIAVEEDEHPIRYYFPRQDVKAALDQTETTTECPFKGLASHYDLVVGDHKLHDAVWSYENPYDEHHDLEHRVAFY